jgi:hypothetical protein
MGTGPFFHCKLGQLHVTVEGLQEGTFDDL